MDGRRKRRDDVDAQVCKSKSAIRHVGIDNLVEFGFKNEYDKLWYSGICIFFVFRGHDAKYVHVVQKPNFNPNMIGVHNPSTAQYNKGNPSLNDINHDVSGTDTAPRILDVLTVL